MDELWDDDDGWMSDTDDDNNKKNNEYETGQDHADDDPMLPGANHVLLYIDCHMMKRTKSDDNIRKNEYHEIDGTMKAIEHMIRSKIRSATINKVGKRDGLGIVFYNTKYRKPTTRFQINNHDDVRQDKNNEEDKDDGEEEDKSDDDDDESENLLWSDSRYTLPTTVHEFLSLKEPGIQTVKAIQMTLPSKSSPTDHRVIDLIDEYCDNDSQHKCESDETNGNIDDELPTTISLQLALHQSLQIFREAKCVKTSKRKTNDKNEPPSDSKQIWIFTNRDNPLQEYHDSNLLTQIQGTMNDLHENGIEVFVWPIRWSSSSSSSINKWFDYTIFYDHIDVYKPLQGDDDDDDNENSTSKHQHEECNNDQRIQDAMILCIQHGWKKTRRTLCLPMLLPNWNLPSIFSTTKDDNNDNDDSNSDKVDENGDKNNLKLSTKVKEENIPDSILSHDITNPGNGRVQPDHCGSSTSDYNYFLESDIQNHWPTKMGIMVDLYRLIQPCKKPPRVPIHPETGRVLSRIRQYVSSGGGEIFAEYKPFEKKSSYKTNTTVSLEERLRRYAMFGGVEVPMTKHDMARIRQSSNNNKEFASLILIGFQPKNLIPFFHKLEHSYFVYPTIDMDDLSKTTKKNKKNDNKKNDNKKNDATSSMSNSLTGCEAFAHLHATMIRKNVVAFGELLTRVTATSRLVVLWPVGEATGSIQQATSHNKIDIDCYKYSNDDDDYEKRLPPGFGMSTIPFEDEVRTQQDDVAIESFVEHGYDVTSKELVDATIELIEKQTISNIEIGESFVNANLQQFWDYVEHIALEEPIDDEDGNKLCQKYDTIIDPKEVMKMVGDQIHKIGKLLPNDDDIINEKKKKKAAQQLEEKKRKRMVEDTSGIDWEAILLDDQLQDCKVNDLKMKLRSIGEVISGNKQQLISRLLPHLQAEFLDRKNKVKKEAF